MKRKIVFIEEKDCVGCGRCLEICPVDAIIGSTNSIHNVIADMCIGCNLCIAVCPTDCIKKKDRLFLNYVIKDINLNFHEVEISSKDIAKEKLMIKSKTMYKKKILR